MSLVNSLAKFARTPQGRKLTDKAMRAAKDPKTKSQLQQLTGRFGSGGTRGKRH